MTEDFKGQTQPEIQAELQRMYAEVKKTLKPCSKNQLIQYIGALLIEVYMLKAQLGTLPKEEKNETVFSKLASFLKR